MSWKNILAPRRLFLPTVGETFDSSGLAVGPEDKIEFLPGSNQCRVNGVEHTLIRSIDSIPLAADGMTIDLARPQRAVKLGYMEVAQVGREHEARRLAKKMWDHTYLLKSEENSPESAQYEPPAYEASEDFAQGLAQQYAKTDPDMEVRTITLRDGSTAEATFDKKTGRQIGTAHRTYSSGQTSLSQQKAPPQSNMPAPPVAPPQACSTGSLELDQFLQLHTGLPGWPLNQISLLQVAKDCSPNTVLQKKAHQSPSITEAFAGVHLAKPSDLITIKTEDPSPTDAFRLIIAEQLPVLQNLLQQTRPNVAILFITPDWDDTELPALLRFLPTKLRLRSETPNQVTATLNGQHHFSLRG